MTDFVGILCLFVSVFRIFVYSFRIRNIIAMKGTRLKSSIVCYCLVFIFLSLIYKLRLEWFLLFYNWFRKKLSISSIKILL